MATLNGTAGNDTLTDSSTDPRSDVYGLGGNDTLYGLGNDDWLHGGAGNDKLYGGEGNDWLFGDAGADKLDGGNGTDGATYFESTGVTVALDASLVAKGEALGDTFLSIEKLEGSDTGADVLAGNSSDNYIWSYGGNDAVYGRAGDDNLFGGAGNDRIYGQAGDDWLYGNLGKDVLSGGTGSDGISYYDEGAIVLALDKSVVARGEAANDKISSIENLEGSNKGSDTLIGTSGSNKLGGMGGADKLYGKGGADWLKGGAGGDLLNGGTGSDAVLYSGSSKGITIALDRSLTGTGEAAGDRFVSIEKVGGTNYNDVISGNSAANTLVGISGDDTLYGRSGKDVFGFFGSDGSIDRIMDFTSGDKIGFQKGQFGPLAGGTIRSGYYLVTSDHVALDANDYFIYDQTDHSLWFDSDGSGVAAASKIAIFANGYQPVYLDLTVLSL